MNMDAKRRSEVAEAVAISNRNMTSADTDYGSRDFLETQTELKAKSEKGPISESERLLLDAIIKLHLAHDCFKTLTKVVTNINEFDDVLPCPSTISYQDAQKCRNDLRKIRKRLEKSKGSGSEALVGPNLPTSSL